jgi:hypothetical protein
MIYLKDMNGTRETTHHEVPVIFRTAVAPDAARSLVVVKASALAGETVLAEVVHEVRFNWRGGVRVWQSSRRVSGTGDESLMLRCEPMADDWVWMLLLGALNGSLPGQAKEVA